MEEGLGVDSLRIHSFIDVYCSGYDCVSSYAIDELTPKVEDMSDAYEKR